jgi:hypothetical protein
MFVEDGPEPTDIAERTFLGGRGRLWSAHHVRDDVMPCEHLFGDNDSVGTAHRAACVLSFL